MARVKRTKQQIQEDIKSRSKVCCVCNERKPFDEFYNFKNKSDGKSYRCKVCDNAARQRYFAKNREQAKRKRREHRLWSVYRITPAEYESMLKTQDYSCAVCGKHMSENAVADSVESLSIDHNHHTGAIRGLLCNQCNRAIGMLQDSPAIVHKAYEYLIKADESTE